MLCAFITCETEFLLVSFLMNLFYYEGMLFAYSRKVACRVPLTRNVAAKSRPISFSRCPKDSKLHAERCERQKVISSCSARLWVFLLVTDIRAEMMFQKIVLKARMKVNHS